METLSFIIVIHKRIRPTLLFKAKYFFVCNHIWQGVLVSNGSETVFLTSSLFLRVFYCHMETQRETQTALLVSSPTESLNRNLFSQSRNLLLFLWTLTVSPMGHIKLDVFSIFLERRKKNESPTLCVSSLWEAVKSASGRNHNTGSVEDPIFFSDNKTRLISLRDIKNNPQ